MAASVTPKISPPSGLKKYWIRPEYHVVAWFLIFSMSFISYLSIHHYLESDYLKSALVKNAIKQSVLVFQVREDNENNKLSLFYNGKVVNAEVAESGKLAIGKLTTTTGIIQDALSRLQKYNKQVNFGLAKIISTFRPSPGHKGFYEAKLTALGLPSLSANGTNQESYIARVYFGNHSPVNLVQENQQGLQKLNAMLASSTILDTSKREKPIVTPKLSLTLKGPTNSDQMSMTNTLVKDSMTRLQDTNEPVENISLDYALVTDVSGAMVVQHINKEFNRNRQLIDKYFYANSPPDCPSCSNKLSQQDEPHDRSSCSMDNFYAKLKCVFEGEVSFFWSFGSWMWYEVILLTLLGVMAETTTRLGMQFTGRDPKNQAWDPRESARSCLKLVSAPVISLVVIWTLVFTDLIQTDAQIEQSGIGAHVTLAFILGVFPNLGFALLQRLAVAIFSYTSMAKPAKSRTTGTVKISPVMPVTKGEPPNFALLKSKAIEHATSVIKH